MSDQTSTEPTMEEILASIRRIISEDEPAASEDAQPGDPPPETQGRAEEAPAPAEEAPAEDDGVLELTDRVETVGDLDVYSPTTAPAAAEPESASYEAPESYEESPEPEPEPAEEEVSGEGLVGAAAASAAATAFGRLSSDIGLGRGDQTLEGIVRELLRPLLKQWLDDNLPDIVQAAVDAEVERIARRRVR